MKKGISVFLLVMATFMVIGCQSKERNSEEAKSILISVNDSSLLLEDVLRLIPSGLTPEDSVEMFNQIVDEWVENRILEDVAMENVIDLERINRLTQNYRNRLIIDQYIQNMTENAQSKVSKKEVEEYYRSYGDSMILEQPILKGIYIRTSEKDPSLEKIRKWIGSGSKSEIDELEKTGLREATGYEYFADRWVQWDNIAPQIPIRVEDADKFLKENKDIDTTHAGSTYLLHVVDFIPSGTKMPKEFALVRINEFLSDKGMSDYRRKLINSLYKKAQKDGKLKIGSYNPFKNI